MNNNQKLFCFCFDRISKNYNVFYLFETNIISINNFQNKVNKIYMQLKP